MSACGFNITSCKPQAPLRPACRPPSYAIWASGDKFRHITSNSGVRARRGRCDGYRVSASLQCKASIHVLQNAREGTFRVQWQPARNRSYLPTGVADSRSRLHRPLGECCRGIHPKGCGLCSRAGDCRIPVRFKPRHQWLTALIECGSSLGWVRLDRRAIITEVKPSSIKSDGGSDEHGR